MRSKLVLLYAAMFCICLAATANAQSYAITNAKIVTVSGPTIDKGTIVIRGGLIAAVGANVATPADAQVFDATGLTVYPGFIDSLTTAGLVTARPATPGGQGGGAAPAATPSSNSNYPAGLRPEDMASTDLRAGESQFDAIRNAGITTVVTTSRNGIFNGQSVVIDLAGDTTSAMIVRDGYAQNISFATLGASYPQSLLGTFSAIRQMFYDAQRLQAWQKAYAADPKGMKRPDEDKSLEALFPAVNGQMPVVFNANNERQIIRAIDLIKELKLNGIIAGGQEAWKVADRLKAANIPVLLSLNFPKRTAANSPEADPEDLETLRLRAETPKCAARLAAAGVRFAFQSGGATSIGDYFTNAGRSVENGLGRDAAIRAMTLGAAEILGVDKVTGSLDAGKIGNVVVVKGELFSKDKFVTHVFVDGKYFEQKEPPKKEVGPTTPGGPAIAAGPNISGSYTITIEIPGQPLSSTLNLTQAGNLLTGTMVSPIGTTPITGGKVEGNSFSFSANVPFGGQSIDIALRGSVTGNSISGTLDSPQGSVPFSGAKTP